MFVHHHLTKAKGHADAVTASPKTAAKGGNYISLMALVMMNVTIVAGVANDVQQAFYGLSSITLFIIGALVFFLPTGLVAAELASGWSQRGGIFRWVGEALGPGMAFTCLLVLWFQTSINFGSGVATASTTIGFFTPDWDWAVNFMNHPQFQLFIMIAWLAFYWFLTWVSTKGVKAFARITKYGVLIGTFIPLVFMVVGCIVWVAQGNRPNVEVTPEAFNPFRGGFNLATLSLAAGVFFSYAGIDMNAAHIKQLKNPKKTFPLSIFIAMILSLIIFIAGTLVIAIVTPESEMNLVYGLNQTYKILGETFNCPWIYVVFVYAGLGTTVANLVTNMAGPSYMLGQAGRSGFLPKQLQSNNKHGMPSRLMYFQMGFMTIIAFLVFLIPNIEGFVILITQSVTILYLLYYVLMFVSFLRLRYNQPNRPRSFKVPGGMAGAWFFSILGLASCAFGIVLAIIPPAQVKAEVGSPVTYVAVILVIIAVVLAIAFGIYRASRKHDWVDPSNEFAPFTWEIEGLKKPQRVTSNVPSEMLAEGQNAMGMPIAKLWDPSEQIVLSDADKARMEAKNGAVAAGDDPAAMNHPVKADLGVADVGGSIPMSQPPQISVAAGIGTAADAGLKKKDAAGASPAVEVAPAPDVPQASAAAVAAEKLPADPAADARAAQAALDAAQQKVAADQAAERRDEVQVAAEKLRMKADSDLLAAERAEKEALAAADQAQAAAPAADQARAATQEEAASTDAPAKAPAPDAGGKGDSPTA